MMAPCPQTCGLDKTFGPRVEPLIKVADSDAVTCGAVPPGITPVANRDSN